MKAMVGRYYFKRHHSSCWAIFQWEEVSETTSSARHITNVVSFEDAVAQTYALNGWGTPKKITRMY